MSLVAIVGRPNVGKSTLFNRLVGQRKAIVDATAGTTRDRHYGKTDWNGKEFSVIDTGGYTVNSEDIFEDEIRRQVLLAIDEFSWSKRTQPYRIRRRIAAMSVADEFHVHIFPEDFPVNIANPENLRRLREAFPGRPVSIVVGSDVVAHASSYQRPPEPDSIHSFDHVIFRRDEVAGPVDYGCIRGLSLIHI